MKKLDLFLRLLIKVFLLSFSLLLIGCQKSQYEPVKTKKIIENDFFKVFSGELKLNHITSDKGGYPQQVFPVDLDNDNNKDFLYFGLKYPFTEVEPEVRLSLIKNLGNGKFVDITQEALGVTDAVHARHMINVDINNDGYKDVIFADHGLDLPPFPGGKSKILINKKGKRLEELYRTFQAFTFFSAADDFDKDGNVEVLFNNISFGAKKKSHFYFFNKDRISIKDISFPKSLLTKRRNFMATTFLKLKGNTNSFLFLGALDGHPKHSERDLLLEFKENQFIESSIILPPRYKDPTWGTVDVQVFDLDYDGDQDIIVSVHNFGFSEGAIQFYENKGNGNFTTDFKKVIEFKNYSNYWIPWIILADIDNDGKKDIVFNINGGGGKGERNFKKTLHAFINQGNFIFKETNKKLPEFGEHFSSVNVFDSNNDGKDDLFITGYRKNFYLYQQK